MALGLKQREAFALLEAEWRGRVVDAPPLMPSVSYLSTETDCPELACLRGLLSPATLDAAAQRAKNIGVGADRVLVWSNAIDDEFYLRALCDFHGFVFETLEGVPPRIILTRPSTSTIATARMARGTSALDMKSDMTSYLTPFRS